jgi:hypothetical protein
LDRIEISYWVAIVALAGIVELEEGQKEEKGKTYITGDCGSTLLDFTPMRRRDKWRCRPRNSRTDVSYDGNLGLCRAEALSNRLLPNSRLLPASSLKVE